MDASTVPTVQSVSAGEAARTKFYEHKYLASGDGTIHRPDFARDDFAVRSGSDEKCPIDPIASVGHLRAVGEGAVGIEADAVAQACPVPLVRLKLFHRDLASDYPCTQYGEDGQKSSDHCQIGKYSSI